MYKNIKALLALLVIISLTYPVSAIAKKRNKIETEKGGFTEDGKAVIWQNPTDIASRNLFFGPGGREHAPHTTFTFIKEDLKGTKPKFVVRDENGVQWKVKLGVEARPEVVASRLVWAVGYFSTEDYYLADLHVENLPPHLTRGQNLMSPGGSFHNVRLKRYLGDDKKIGPWRWRQNPFVGTREFNGLRVMMALINSWDLKDNNNAIYEEKRAGTTDGPELIYLVSDLGVSFGTTGRSWTTALSEGNLDSYCHSKFISKVTADHVDFCVPTRPALIGLFALPWFISQLRLRWIGRNIPRADVEWIGQSLSQLSPQQIHDAFRAAGYSPQEVEGFSKVVQQRILELNELKGQT
jgi:hypothetical protein